ncbi:MAG: mechanosensitive ion channel family protein [Pseudoclavibacter sp.]
MLPQITFPELVTTFEVPLWIVAYILGGLLLHWILQRVIKRFVNSVVKGVKKRKGADDTQELTVKSPLAAVRTVQHTRTLGSVLSNILSVALVVVVIMLIIGRAAPNVLTSLSLLSAAVGAGLGFGAQKIVGDVLNGLFMVMEDQLGVGDEVDMGEAIGIVEKVGVRVTQVRDVNGTLWFIRNGEVTRVGSNSQGWNRAIIDLAVPYHVDRRRVEEVMLATAVDMYNDPEWAVKFYEEPQIWGLETISAEAIVVRLVAKTKAGTRWEIQRELRARIQEAFKNNGISLPPLNTIVFNGPNGISNRVEPFDPQNPAATEPGNQERA